MKSPFESLDECFFYYLSIKMVFVIAITLGERVKMPFNSFHKDKVILRSDLRFLTKVECDFHISQTINLLVYPPKQLSNKGKLVLHTLDDRKAFVYYLGRTKRFL